MSDDEKVSSINKSRQVRLGRIIQKLVLPLLGIGLIIYGALGIYRRWYATHHQAPIPPVASTDQQDEQAPAETPIPVNAKPPFSYAASEPMIISLPSIDKQGYIQKVSVDKNNAVGVPSNIHLAGWYTNSVKPGDEGLSIIDGHVTGKYSDGIFKKLSEIKAGDELQIEFGDKKIKKFKAIEIKRLPEAESAAYLFSQRKGIKSQLNIITCGGKFNKDSQSYADRIIVVAKLLDS